MIFSIAMGADYSFYVKSIATYAPAFFGHNNSVLARVAWVGLSAKGKPTPLGRIINYNLVAVFIDRPRLLSRISKEIKYVGASLPLARLP